MKLWPLEATGDPAMDPIAARLWGMGGVGGGGHSEYQNGFLAEKNLGKFSAEQSPQRPSGKSRDVWRREKFLQAG